MADKEKLDDDELDLGSERSSVPVKLILITVLAVILTMGIGSGATWLLLSSTDKQAQTDAVEEGEEEVAEEEQEPRGQALYHALEPAFIVNLPPGQKAKMLQVQVQLMTRKPEMHEFLKNNDPMIRHALLAMFSTQNSDNLRDREGKEKLQQEILAEVRRIAAEEGAPGEVEAVFFTGFVMQ